MIEAEGIEKSLEIQIEASTVCPLSCIHCSACELLRSDKTPEGLIYNVAELISRIDAKKQIWITGGEPLMLESLPNYSSLLSSAKNTKVGLFTCGCKLENGRLVSVDIKNAQILKDSGIDSCYVSVYHYLEEVHNHITNRDSYSLTMESIRNFLLSGIETRVHLPLTSYAAKDIFTTIDFLCELGVSEVRILRLAKNGSAERNWDELSVREDVQDEIIESLIENKWPISVSISGYPHKTACRSLPGSSGCQAGSSLLFITRKGDVYPCACVKNSHTCCLGNVFENTALHEIITYEIKKDRHIFTCLNAV